MANPPTDYPTTPPPWLDAWPNSQTIRTLFAEGIRRHCYRIMGREKIRAVTWTENSLTVQLGDQQATWQFRNNAWRRLCTCGYSSDRCAHAYAAALVFADIRQRENWGAGAGAETVRTHSRETGAPQPGNAAPPKAAKIEAEMDFHHVPGLATARLYLTQDGHRGTLRLQQAMNLGVQAQRGTLRHLALSAADLEFLRWLPAQIRKHPALQQNLRVLKLRQTEFKYWLDYWENRPGRFIDRSSQAPLSAQGKAARLVIELRDRGDWVEIAALIVTPKGDRHHVHEIFQLLASGKRDLVLDGQLLDFDPPISWALIADVFSRKTPRMRREHVCEHLPHLLEGRLDLVEGACVDREETTGTVHLAAASDGADILLHARVGTAPILADNHAAAGGLRVDRDRFVVTAFTAPELPQVRQFLRNLPLTRTADAGLRLAGNPANISRLLSGWERLPESVKKDASPELAALLDRPAAFVPEIGLIERRNFIDLQLCWTCGDTAVAAAEIRDAVHAGGRVLRTRGGQWLQIDPERLAAIQSELAELGFSDDSGQRFFRPEADAAISTLTSRIGCTISPHSRQLLHTIQDLRAPRPVPPLPAELEPVLRHYQKQGFEFLADRYAHGVGAILADDMGLGKTLQVLALLAAQADQHSRNDAAASTGPRRTLVVCPASVVTVWLDQAATFCPSLRCAAYVGPAARRTKLLRAGDWDLLVTNYALARSDVEELSRPEFDLVVLDEAQFIKNPDAQVTQAVKRLRPNRALALTGTPLENRLLDLWSILDFLNPDFLGSQEAFLRRYGEPQQTDHLARRVAPVILRRTKENVAPELPPRTEETLKIELTPEQRAIYDSELLRARHVLHEKGPVEVLAALTRLRQVCCHPQLLLKRPVDAGSAKLEVLEDMVVSILDEGHSVLIFSQFTSMLEIMEKRLLGMPTFKITGRTPAAKRADLIREFSASDAAQVFLLSLRAAGTGITLTKADYVFIYDPWWNPAVEYQAIDRTHRLGQDKPVIAYRLVAADTVEEKVQALQQEKAKLFAAVMEDAENSPHPQRLSTADLAGLLA